MFLRLWQTNEAETSAKQNALFYIKRALKNVRENSRSSDEYAFLCGNAGIYAVAAAISHKSQQYDVMKDELAHFERGFDACLPTEDSMKFDQSNGNDSDEFLVGRAGFLGKLPTNLLFISSTTSKHQV